MFDFDATLPLMAVQFLVLTFVLNAVFYKPLTKVLDERDNYVRKNEIDSREKLSKAEQIVKEYEKQIAQARRESQVILEKAQAEAKEIIAQKTAEAQKQVQAEREKAAQEIQQQKAAALTSLEQEVDVLSRQILEKLLGPELVKS
ncbi:ATP synthase F0 subcomplex B' subunit [Stanieria cyanosphaera PCC 7437]|uniref:ATP synthase subunit b' n=1 Tax=Stanieria cyanosphaera (strain ATCC 29371 / PCC 7437) TaxID=111780 RepID=K9XXF2_STAC7|nr:F0F1 ATP synthase subunit B' [Stanieria cyanosphaera]AFZ36739.1 ATP synthase F0 subcomplex B' subunit [Stanieria cyanosphaera PCC 7437]